MGVVVALYLCQHLVLPVVLILATLVGVQWYLIVGLHLIWHTIITKMILFLPPTFKPLKGSIYCVFGSCSIPSVCSFTQWQRDVGPK